MEVLNDVKVSFNFNLRKPKRNETTTQIYCVVRVGDKQIKMPLGLKVYAYQWNKQKQTCVVSANMGDNERANNINANRKLNAVRCTIDEIFCYLCTNEEMTDTKAVETYIKGQLSQYATTETTNHMSNKNAIPPKRTITATTLLKQAFKIFYNADGGQKESTITVQECRLNKFFQFIEQTKKGDTPKLLTQDGLNDYKEWLENTANANGKGSAKVINQHCQLIARLINKVLAVRSEYRKYNFSMVVYVNIEDKRKKDDHYKRALTESELSTFNAYTPKSEKEKEIKDLFTLQLQTGVRKGDLVKLVNGDYTVNESNPTYAIVETEKEGITAVIEKAHIDAFNAKYPKGLQVININGKTFETTYNKGLKAIFKAANLTSVEHYKMNVAGRNIEQTAPLDTLISNHFARHTFITMKVREGWTPDILCNMTGHADDRMIKEVYEHLTKEDKINAVMKEKARLNGGVSANTSTVGMSANIIANQAVENYKLQKENEIRELKNRLATHSYDLGTDLIIMNRVERLHHHLNPQNIYNEVFDTFPTDKEKAEIMNGKETMTVLNERLNDIGLQIDDHLKLSQTDDFFTKKQK